MKVFLIGLPGSGKTTLGKLLALEMNCLFIDLDKAIESAASKTIPEIFQQHGEEEFRRLEKEQLMVQIEQNTSFVLSTGGGTPCFFDNIDRMNKAGKTVFLDVPTREIVKRIHRTDRAERPLLGRVHPDELKDTIETLRTRRLPFFLKATLTVSGEKITPEDLVKLLTA